MTLEKVAAEVKTDSYILKIMRGCERKSGAKRDCDWVQIIVNRFDFFYFFCGFRIGCIYNRTSGPQIQLNLHFRTGRVGGWELHKLGWGGKFYLKESILLLDTKPGKEKERQFRRFSILFLAFKNKTTNAAKEMGDWETLQFIYPPSVYTYGRGKRRGEERKERGH